MKTKTVEAEPSEQALEDVRAMARNSIFYDGWMHADVDDHNHIAEPDYGQFVGFHRDGWESTCHFEIMYRHPISQIALEEAIPFGVGRRLSEDKKFWVGPIQDFNQYWYGIFEPLLQEFWEQWEETHHLYEKWAAARVRWDIDTYNLFTGIYWPGMKGKKNASR